MSRSIQAKRYGLVALLWVLFSLCCFAAPFLALFFRWYPKGSYPRRFVRAADKLIAAMLGFSGRFTLSAELADHSEYQWLRDILNTVEPNHCELEAFSEGAYCRISDHQRGDR